MGSNGVVTRFQGVFGDVKYVRFSPGQASRTAKKTTRDGFSSARVDIWIWEPMRGKSHSWSGGRSRIALCLVWNLGESMRWRLRGQARSYPQFTVCQAGSI